MIFDYLDKKSANHEQINFYRDSKTGLKAIVAIHNTQLGPALGGCRMHPYSNEQEALEDVLNLSQAMSYKSAFAGLELGGGKSVIIGNPETDKNPELLRSFGRFIESLSGRYITAKDVGITDKDLKIIGEETSHVIGKPKEEGGLGSPSYSTAKGVFYGLKMGVKLKLKKTSLKNIHVVIQGAGSVGIELMRLLLEEGAKISISDINKKTLKNIEQNYPSVSILSLEDVFKTSCDVFSPCAMGGVLNKETFKTLNCSLIAGAANNQLESNDLAQQFFDKGIFYLPDFVLNSGGIIYVYSVVPPKKSNQWVEDKFHEIPKSIEIIHKISEDQKISTVKAALQFVKEKLNSSSKKEQSLIVKQN